MPAGIRPAPVADYVAPAGDNDALCHIAAISMDRSGLPVRLFTVNRWVAGDIWYDAADVIAMIDRFSIDLDEPSQPVNAWISAMMVLFKPQIASLLIERDRTVAAWRHRNPESDVFEDRRLDITSMVDISLHRQIAALDRALDRIDGITST